MLMCLATANWRREQMSLGASGAQGCRYRISSHYAAALGACRELQRDFWVLHMHCSVYLLQNTSQPLPIGSVHTAVYVSSLLHCLATM